MSVLYPPWYQKKLSAWKRGEIDWNGNEQNQSEQIAESESTGRSNDHGVINVRRLLVCLSLDSLPSLFTLVTLLSSDRAHPHHPRMHPSKITKDKSIATKTSAEIRNSSPRPKRPLEVHGLHLLELTERLSSVMQESEITDWSRRDPIVDLLHTFGQLNNIAVSGEAQLVAEAAYSDVLVDYARYCESDLILLPWGKSGNDSRITLPRAHELEQSFVHTSIYNQLVGKFLESTPCDTAVLVNTGFDCLPKGHGHVTDCTPKSLSPRIRDEFLGASGLDHSYHIFVPFSGGSDDRMAVRFALRLARHPSVTLTISMMSDAVVHHKTETEVSSTQDVTMASEPQEKARGLNSENAFFQSTKQSLSDELQSRVVFDDSIALETVQKVEERASEEFRTSVSGAANLIVVGRGSNLEQRVGQADSAIQALGRRATAMLSADVQATMVVTQSSREPRRRYSTQQLDPCQRYTNFYDVDPDISRPLVTGDRTADES